jgi:hypothetical protein
MFRGKEYVRIKWANKNQEEWVEKSEFIQGQPTSERKCQKPKVLTSNKIGELSDNPSERKENVDIVLSDKQETCLHEIYQRMPNVGGGNSLIKVYTMMHSTWRFGNSVSNDLWIFGQEKSSVHIKLS